MSIIVILGLILTTTTTNCIILNPKGPIHQNYATNCILEILKHQFVVPQKKISLLAMLTTFNLSTRAYGIQNKIIIDVNHLLNWSVEILNGEQIEFESSEICLNCPSEEKEILKNIFQPKYKPNFCMMVTDNFENFLKGLENYLSSTILFIPGFFLVYVSDISPNYEKLAKDVLVTLWNYTIINSAVIIPKNSLRTFNIYSLDGLVQSERCVEAYRFRLMDTCKRGKMDKNKPLFGNKLPKTFHNCSIKTIAVKYPPFVINQYHGFEINVLKQLGMILNISFNLQVEENSVDWGTRLSKNNWTGPLENAFSSSAIAIGNVKADPDIAEDFTLTMDYFYEHMVWVVPIAHPIPRWKNIFVIFQYKLWLACIGYFILTAILFQITSKSKDELKCYKNLGTNFMTSLQILVGIASPQHPKTIMVRTAFMSLSVYSIYIILLYQTLLITFLTNPVYEEQISTVEDILYAQKGIGGLESYKDYFNVTTDERAMKIYRMFEISDNENDTVYNWISMVGDFRNTCTISSSFYVKYLLAEYNQAVISHGRPKIFVMKEILFTYPVRMVLPKGFPLADKFNKIIGNLVNGGIVNQWAKSYHQHMGQYVESEDDDMDDEDTSITVDHLQGAFCLLIYGYTFGFVSLMVELLVNKIGKTKKYKELKRYFRKNPKKYKRKKK